MKFEIGDRVICTHGHWFEHVEGIVGTIVCFKYSNEYGEYADTYDEDEYEENIGIKFDAPLHYGHGHDLDGVLEEKDRKKGYWINHGDLELISKKKKTNKELY